MKYIMIGIVFLGGGLLTLTQYEQGSACPRSREYIVLAQAPTVVAAAANAQETPKASNDAANKAILANVKAFVEAFNKKDAAAIVPLFSEDCQLIEHDGTEIHGAKDLAAELKEEFAADPGSQISVSVDSLRFITPDVAIEEGKTAFYPDGKTLTAETEYQATHVKKGDRWLMAQVRSFNRTVLSPYDSLRDLEWLVGEWVDESTESLAESRYYWDENKTFLLHDFTVRIKGKSAMKGTQRIGWDALTKQIKAWVFDSEGGHAESLWTPIDGGWVIKAKGVRSDGKVVTVTNQLFQLTKDRMRLESSDRVVGDERTNPVVGFAVRRPPAAKN